ncbi:uncharacterized protein LOC135387145 [Ornithodoros turicata]
MRTDPDHPSTPHSCDPAEDAEAATVLSRRYMYEVRTDVRTSRKRPRQAFDEAVSAVQVRFQDDDASLQNDIKRQMSTSYGFASKRRALSRNRHANIPKGNSIDAILPELRITKDGQQFLQLEDKTEGRRLLVFYAEKDLDAFANTEYILGDGNFKYNPSEFHSPGQLYTIHAIVKGEAHPIVYALMQATDVRAYQAVFHTLKESMVRRFGHVGSLSTTATWLFDYESAAIRAALNVFQTATGEPNVRGCAFHYAKAINKKRDELGLKVLCRENAEVNRWFVRVRHLPFVPDDFRLAFADDILSVKPDLPPLHAARLALFDRYYRAYWLTNSLLKDRWGQFGNRGPRTTNHVEGWHNGLHSRFTCRHPNLAEFLEFLRVSQHAVQNRVQALLLDPLAVPTPTSAAVRERNASLLQEMDSFSWYLSTSPVSFMDLTTYLDRIALVGVLPSES